MNKPTKIKAIIFDCDGVLLDSELLFIENLIQYLKSKGINTSLDDVKKYIGIPLDEIIRMIINDYNLSDNFKEIEKYFNENDSVINHPDKLKHMSGVIDFIKEAYKKELILAVGSSSPIDYVLTVLNQFEIKKYFSLILTISEVPNGKPSPDIYNEIVKRLNLNKDEVIVIEDSTIGIKAANSAGIFCIGFKGSLIMQDTSNADMSAYSYKEVKKILNWEE